MIYYVLIGILIIINLVSLILSTISLKNRDKDYFNEYNNPKKLIKYVRESIIPNSEIKYNKNLFKHLWYRYNIGDMIFFGGYEYNKMRKEKIELFKKYEWWPTSIAAQYYKKSDKKGDLRLIKSIIDKYKLKSQNIILIHLRIGDVFTQNGVKAECGLEEFISNGCEKTQKWLKKLNTNSTHYIKPLSYYIEKLKKMKDTGLKNIQILAGGINCNDECMYISYEYVMVIKTFFEKNGFEVKLRLGNTPDNDLIYASNCKYFLPGGGGYSNLIKSLVKLNGGEIL